MRKRLLVPIFTALLFALAASPASAKDLRKRFGLGFNNQFSPVANLSVKYGFPAKSPTINIQVQGIVGFAFAKSAETKLFAGGRLLFTVIAEDNLNVYVGAGGGYARFSDGTAAARIQPVAGVEFFFFGLDNLGVSGEVGLNVDIGPDGIEVFTASSMFAGVGLHYYL
ncbi:hypothetical protein L6R50_11850 [Myxococcota bacterium]|nr:hypothetical protein [Myxococcota bacterium]